MILPFVIHIPILIAIIFYHFKRQANSELKLIYWPALFFKLSAGIFIGILYTHYYPYGGDTFVYHNYSVKLNHLANENFNDYLRIIFLDDYEAFDKTFFDLIGQSRVLFMIKLLSPLNLLTLNSYWINSLYLSLFSFVSLWSLANYLIYQYKIKASSIAISFFCFPTFVVWSSGVLKESIIIGIIALLIYWFLNAYNTKQLSYINVIAFIILAYVGWKLKFFYIVILLVTMVAFALLKLVYSTYYNFPLKKLIVIASGLISLVILSILLTPDSVVQYLLDIMYISYRDMIGFSREGTYFTFDKLEPTLSSYLINFPKALFTGLFRPFIWEVSGVLTLLESMENAIIILLFLGCVYQVFKKKGFTFSSELIALFFYIIISASLMAFIAPNWGTLSRYKVSFQFLWVMILWQYSFPTRQFSLKLKG